MKRYLFMLVNVLLTVTLCACTPQETTAGSIAVVESNATATVPDTTEAKAESIPETTTPAATEAEVDEAVLAYRAILAGQSDFFDYDTTWAMSFDGDSRLISDKVDEVMVVKRFVMVDLDADGYVELILQLSNGEDPNVGFKVLRYSDHDVYGYSLTYRNFDHLKADGTFRVSGGAYDYGIGTMRFSDNNWYIDRVVSCETATLDDGSTEEQYYVNGESVAKDEFEAIYSQQGEKPDAPWYEFNAENLALVGINLAE